ncbi:hypothetical protein D3C77_447890 [compost metagenome]
MLIPAIAASVATVNPENRAIIMPNKTCSPIKRNVCLRVNTFFLEMLDVVKNKMKPPMSAPTQAGTASKVGALPFAVEAVIGLNTFSSETIGFTSTAALLASICPSPICATKSVEYWVLN